MIAGHIKRPKQPIRNSFEHHVGTEGSWDDVLEDVAPKASMQQSPGRLAAALTPDDHQPGLIAFPVFQRPSEIDAARRHGQRSVPLCIAGKLVQRKANVENGFRPKENIRTGGADL